MSYQYELTTLDFSDEERYLAVPVDLFDNYSAAQITRDSHGFASIVKLHFAAESGFFKISDLDISYRRDLVYDEVDNAEGPKTLNLSSSNWDESMVKFSSNISGFHNNLHMNGYMNYGRNYKFPTVLQQMSTSSALAADVYRAESLRPEKSKYMELGLEFTHETPSHRYLEGWALGANYFLTNYTNKIRLFYLPFSPIAFYDNIHRAKISGLELRGGLYFLSKKLAFEFSSANYAIPEKVAFPLKSELKNTINVTLQHAGYSARIDWYNESEQVAWVRSLEGEFLEVVLPEYTGMDVHLGKHFDIRGLRFAFNFSGRNLIGSGWELEGIAIRDRRFYFSFGVQY